MIETKLVRQIVTYEHPAELLEKELERIQARGHKVLEIKETKVSKMLGCSDQAFLIIYEIKDYKIWWDNIKFWFQRLKSKRRQR